MTTNGDCNSRVSAKYSAQSFNSEEFSTWDLVHMLTSLFTLHTFFACLECQCRRCPDLIWRIWCCVCTHIDNWQRCMKRICYKDEFFKRSVDVFVKAKSCSYLVEGRYSSRSKYVNCDPTSRCFLRFQHPAMNGTIEREKIDMTFFVVTFVCLSCPLIISIDNENSSFFYKEKNCLSQKWSF